MSTDALEFATDLAARWKDWWPSHFTPDHCIAGSSICLVEAERAGLTAKVVPVRVIAANATATGLIERQVPQPMWPDNAWSVGAYPGGGRPSAKAYNGHVVCVLDDAVLVDLAVQAMNRPRYNILIDHPLVAEWSNDTAGLALPRRGTIVWQRVLDAPLWHTAPDWKRRRKMAAEFRNDTERENP